MKKLVNKIFLSIVYLFMAMVLSIGYFAASCEILAASIGGFIQGRNDKKKK